MHFVSNPSRIGSNRILLDEVNSTQDFANQYLSQNADSHGVAIISRFQSKGKGRFDKHWNSNAGENFTGSILLNAPDLLHAHNFGLLHMAVSLAVSETLQTFLSQPVYIKWPNDILVNTKKISGILIHLKWLGNRLDKIICGIGINVNQKSFSDVLNQATSIFLVSGRQVDLNHLANVLFDQLNRFYTLVSHGPIVELVNQYHLNLYGMNDQISFLLDDCEYFGTIKQVGLDGKILIEYSKGFEWFDIDQIKINY